MNLIRLWLLVAAWAFVGASLDHSLPYYVGWSKAVLYSFAALAVTLGLCVTNGD